MLVLRVIDNMKAGGIIISLHDEEGFKWISISEDEWKQFKAAGDDAMDIGLGRKPPRSPDDPNFFRGLPIEEENSAST